MNRQELVGARIREAREALGLSGRAAAKKADVSESRLRQIEHGWQRSRTGEMTPAYTTAETLVQIARALEMDELELLDLAELEPPAEQDESPKPELPDTVMLDSADFTDRERALLRMFFDWAKDAGRQEGAKRGRT